MRGGGGSKMSKNTPLFRVENLLAAFNFEPKKCFRVMTPWGMYGAEWDRQSCSLYIFQPFLLFRRFFVHFGDLGNPVAPTLKGASSDVMTVSAY